MTKLSIAIVALFTTACVARAGFGVAGPTPPTAVIPIGPGAPPPAGVDLAQAQPAAAAAPAAAPAAPAGHYAPGEDAHWFQADDYLIGDKKYEHEKMTVQVAKMIAAPAGGTKGEGQFLYATGDQKWTAAYYKTKVATRGDLAVGAIAFCYAPWWGGNAPEDKQHARNNGWMMAAITDNADLYKGRVTVGGNSCALGAVRVLVQ